MRTSDKVLPVSSGMGNQGNFGVKQVDTGVKKWNCFWDYPSLMFADKISSW